MAISYWWKTKTRRSSSTCASFSEGVDFFNDYITPRSVNGAGDYFEFGLLPEIKGVYSEHALQNTRLKYCRPEIEAVLLSHYHYDHTGRIWHTDPDIPICCGQTTELLHQAYSESRGSPLDGHKIKTFRTGDKFKVGAIEVKPVHVDHSIPGAYGFILHTSEGAIVYTGDFRFHGPMGKMTQDFVARAAEAEPAIVLSEGTRVAGSDHAARLSEAQVAQETDIEIPSLNAAINVELGKSSLEENVATASSQFETVVIASDSRKVLEKIAIPEVKEGQNILKSSVWNVPDLFRLDGS